MSSPIPRLLPSFLPHTVQKMGRQPDNFIVCTMMCYVWFEGMIKLLPTHAIHVTIAHCGRAAFCVPHQQDRCEGARQDLVTSLILMKICLAPKIIITGLLFSPYSPHIHTLQQHKMPLSMARTCKVHLRKQGLIFLSMLVSEYR